MISIEQFLLRKNIAQNAVHAKLIMIGVIILCLIIIVLINRPGSRANISEFSEEEIRSFDADDLLLLQESSEIETASERERRVNQYDPNIQAENTSENQ